MAKKRKPTYTLKAETGYLKARRPKIKGAVVINGRQLMAMTKQLLDRLDATTAWLMDLQKSNGWKIVVNEVDLDGMINANMAVLDKFRGGSDGQV